MNALEERRQAAREAGFDEVGNIDGLDMTHAVEAAIETATRVRITHEILMAFIEAPETGDMLDITGPLRAAFEAAGFEVER